MTQVSVIPGHPWRGGIVSQAKDSDQHSAPRSADYWSTILTAC